MSAKPDGAVLAAADAFDRGPIRRADRFVMRTFSVRHAAMMERAYALLERTLTRLAPALARIGFARLEKPTEAVEGFVKRRLFDCRMCGQCILSSTGMSCPMNCPKNLRNGPCGGVRMDGRCEVHPEMACVWVLAFEGSRHMTGGARIADRQPPIDHRLKGRSTWLALAHGSRAAS